MPADLFSRINLDELYAPAVPLFLELAANCRERGVDYHAISGYRSMSAQAVLFFQGRTTDGPIVTNARPGFSWHNWGLAVDFCRDSDVSRRGLQPAWGNRDYDVLGEEAAKIPGLEWGGIWIPMDLPHVQYRVTRASLRELTDLYREAGSKMPPVWEYLDAKRKEASHGRQ